jgi:hemoglobin
MDLLDTHIFSIIGADGFERLTSAFYRRVATDPILLPMYPKEDLDEARARLRDFLIQRFGGPDGYSAARGHPRLRMRHARFHINQVARDRWRDLMELALLEADLPDDVLPLLRRFFDESATFMINAQ